MNKFFGNVNLHRSQNFFPHHLESKSESEREAAREIVQNYMKHIAEVSNSNLIQNANCLMAKNEAKIEFSWVTNTHPQSQTKFKLGY